MSTIRVIGRPGRAPAAQALSDIVWTAIDLTVVGAVFYVGSNLYGCYKATENISNASEQMSAMYSCLKQNWNEDVLTSFQRYTVYVTDPWSRLRKYLKWSIVKPAEDDWTALEEWVEKKF